MELGFKSFVEWKLIILNCFIIGKSNWQRSKCDMNSNKIKKFETILESVKVPSNMGVEQQKQLMTPINAIVEVCFHHDYIVFANVQNEILMHFIGIRFGY